MRLVLGCDQAVAAWTAARIEGCARGFGKCSAIGVAHDGDLIAGVVFHDWNPEAEIIELSAAATDRRWMTRSNVTGILNYPFGFCQMVVSRFAPDGPPRRIFNALGADEFVIPRLRGRDADGVLATLTREQWATSPMNKERLHHG